MLSKPSSTLPVFEEKVLAGCRRRLGFQCWTMLFLLCNVWWKLAKNYAYCFKHHFSIFKGCIILPVGFPDHSMVSCNVLIANVKHKPAYWNFKTALLLDIHFRETFIFGKVLELENKILHRWSSGGILRRWKSSSFVNSTLSMFLRTLANLWGIWRLK